MRITKNASKFEINKNLLKMFYRLLKISAWARRHPKLAILVIILLQTIFILLSLYLGHLLRQYGYVLGRPFLFVGFMLIIDGIFLFPHRDELKEIFVNPRKLWVKIIASTFIFVGAMILLMGYAGKKEFKTDSGQGLITRAYAIETAPHSAVTQSQLERDYATKFIVKLNPEETAKTLGFWRILRLIFIVLLLLAISYFTVYLVCDTFCYMDIVLLAFLVVDTILFYWGVIAWLIHGGLKMNQKYSKKVGLGILSYFFVFSLYLILFEDFAYSLIHFEDYPLGQSFVTITLVVLNFIISILVFYWGRNKPLFGTKHKEKKQKL